VVASPAVRVDEGVVGIVGAQERNRLNGFLELSAALTGFDEVELLGTGVADEYLRTLEGAVPAGVLDDLLGNAKSDAEAVLADEVLGPVARDVTVMWYCGSWQGEVVSPDAYVAGLQWVAAGAHPIGARQQGFGAWALPPEEVQ
jgi:hypothetical protein